MLDRIRVFTHGRVCLGGTCVVTLRINSADSHSTAGSSLQRRSPDLLVRRQIRTRVETFWFL